MKLRVFAFSVVLLNSQSFDSWKLVHQHFGQSEDWRFCGRNDRGIGHDEFDEEFALGFGDLLSRWAVARLSSCCSRRGLPVDH